VTHAPNQRYELKTPSDLGDFDFVSQQRARVDGADTSTTTITVKLQAFTLGPQRTPALTLQITEPGGATELEAAGTNVEVLSSLPPDAQTKGENLYDVRPPEELPIRTWRLLYALGIALGVGALAWAVSRWLARRKLDAVLNEPPPRPVDTRALEALDALAAQNLPGAGRYREFYFRLSEIVRAYLGELYSFEALESTTPELLNALNSRRTPGLAMSDLSAFAAASDFIRYAKTEPAVEDCKSHLELAYRIVHETTVATKALAAANANAKSATGASPGGPHGAQ
jgi:hypothetical protein